MRYFTILLLLVLSLGAKAQVDSCDEQIQAASNTPCSHKILHLAVNQLPNTTYSWEGPRGWTALGDTVTRDSMNANKTGDYIVTGIRGICTYKDTVNIYIRATPYPPLITSLNSPVCVGDTLKVTAVTMAMDFEFYFYGPGSPQNPQGYFEFAPYGSITIPDMQKSMEGQYACYQIGRQGCYSDTTYFNVQVDSCTLNVADMDTDKPFIPTLLQSADPIFKPIFKSGNEAYKMQVFDPTGKKVFETNSSEGWDRSSSHGEYYYIITRKSSVYKGRLMLL